MKEIIFLLNTTRFKLKHNVFLIILTLLLLYSCTSVQKTTQAKDQSSSAVPITTKQDSAQTKLLHHILEEKLLPEYKSLIFKEN
jgi:hypothetical protein